MTSADNPTAIDWPAELLRHREWMHGVARARLGDEHAAEDVMQDVSLAVIRQNGRPTDPGKVRAWLYQVVVRRAADYFRKQYRQAQLVEEFAGDPAAVSHYDDAGWVTRSESSAILRAALGRMPDEDRQMFVLKYVENWSYRQLAERFQVSERTVEYRLVRAKQRLRTQLRSLQAGDER